MPGQALPPQKKQPEDVGWVTQPAFWQSPNRRRRVAVVVNPLALVALLSLLGALGTFEAHVLTLIGLLLSFNSWLLQERLLARAAAPQRLVLLSRALYAVVGAGWLRTAVAA
jgi:hypothetical protein